MMWRVCHGYLENPVEVPLVYLEALDRHWESQVLSATYFREPAVVKNPPSVYELSLKNIGGGYDPVGFAYLGKKQ